MKRIAIVCQRYGIEVNGGAEYHARILAEKLSLKYEVTVLTTTAIDYHTWENYYTNGTEYVNGIAVNRFPTVKSSDRQLRKSRRIIFQNRKYFKFLKAIRIFNFLNKKLRLTKVTEGEAQRWLKHQGPYSPRLIQYILHNEPLYDIFIFFTYLYYPTAVGMPLVKNKALFIPTAHDEPPLYTQPYQKLFAVPKFIMYNSLAEKKLVEKHFTQYTKASNIAGVGVSRASLPANKEENLQLLPPGVSYFLYIGRIEPNKGCGDLVHFFEKYAAGKNVKLIMVGKDLMNLPASDSIIKTGFISETAKNQILKNCKALIIPSKYESLSIVALEAMMEGKIIIVNGHCEVLKDHIQKSESGFYYKNFEQFNEILNNILGMTEREAAYHQANAINYVKTTYSWDSILLKFDEAISYIVNS